MSKYINIKQTLICLGIFACLVIAIIIAYIPDADEYTKYGNYIKSTVLLTAGNEKMHLDEGVFLAKNQQSYYELLYLTNEKALDWSAQYDGDVTLEAQILKDSLEFTKKNFALSCYAKENNISLSDKELEEVDKNVSDFLTQSKKPVLDATYATKDLLTRVYTRTALFNKVCEEIYKDTDLSVSDEEARQCLVEAVEINPAYFDSPKRTAEKIYERVNSGEIIRKVAEVYDAVSTTGNVGQGSMDGNAFEKLCLSLKDGESGIADVDGTYFVVFCHLANDPEATEISKENLISAKKSAAINSFYEAFEKDHPITINMDAWNTINYSTPIFTGDNYAD